MNDDSMNDDSLDLSSLDATRDNARFDAITASIARDAMIARRARRAAPPDLLAGLVAWSRPALAAAAIVLGVALPTLAYSRHAAATRAASADEVIGIPRELTELLRSSQTPSLVQIHDALTAADGGVR